jgi:hypothetical protein
MTERLFIATKTVFGAIVHSIVEAEERRGVGVVVQTGLPSLREVLREAERAERCLVMNISNNVSYDMERVLAWRLLKGLPITFYEPVLGERFLSKHRARLLGLERELRSAYDGTVPAALGESRAAPPPRPPEPPRRPDPSLVKVPPAKPPRPPPGPPAPPPPPRIPRSQMPLPVPPRETLLPGTLVLDGERVVALKERARLMRAGEAKLVTDGRPMPEPGTLVYVLEAETPGAARKWFLLSDVKGS